MPAREPRLTVRAINPLLSGLRALGHDAAPLLDAAGIDARQLRDPDVRVPMAAVLRLIDRAVAQTGDDNLGLHLAEHADLGSGDVHFYAMLASRTLGDAYSRLCRYQRLIRDTSRIELEYEPGRAMLRHVMTGHRAESRHSAEFLLAVWVRAGRLITGIDWTPLDVHFTHAAPDNAREHAAFFRCALHFGMTDNALILPASLLETPCVRADESLIAVLDRYAAARIDPEPVRDDIVDRVRSTLADELKGGQPTATQLAARLNMSVRSLSRSLAAVGTSYGQVLDDLRREQSLKHLAGERFSISEIAFLLGFVELSSFNRVFKRWTGETPAEFRRRALRGT
jgi:AraC-like DNA-binding protein